MEKELVKHTVNSLEFFLNPKILWETASLSGRLTIVS